MEDVAQKQTWVGSRHSCRKSCSGEKISLCLTAHTHPINGPCLEGTLHLILHIKWKGHASKSEDYTLLQGVGKKCIWGLFKYSWCLDFHCIREGKELDLQVSSQLSTSLSLFCILLVRTALPPNQPVRRWIFWALWELISLTGSSLNSATLSLSFIATHFITWCNSSLS